MTRDTRSVGDVVADHITEFGSSWRFIILGFLLLLFWIAVNVVQVFAFDPSLTLLNLFLSFIAAFQAPFIMMSQR